MNGKRGKIVKAARSILEFLKINGVRYMFGIPAGSVNAIFDELYEMTEITPVVTKHEGAASYMAAAYAKYSSQLSVVIGCSGPGGTNLVTGAANALREHLPVLFLTGAVPVNTMGLNASQELDASPIFAPVTKYSVIVKDASSVLAEVNKACQIAISGVPGPVHVALPIDVQHAQTELKAELQSLLSMKTLTRTPMEPDQQMIDHVVAALLERKDGCILAGQGVRGSVDQLLELADLLHWPILVTPQAKGYLPDDHPLLVGIFGFAGHTAASDFIANEQGKEAILIVGSSLGETATSNYNAKLVHERLAIQLDFDETVFNRKYAVDFPVLGDISISLSRIIDGLKKRLKETPQVLSVAVAEAAVAAERLTEAATPTNIEQADGTTPFFTKQVLQRLQQELPEQTRYTIDIGEFMSYVIHDMRTVSEDSYSINVHFGAMGSGIGSAIGSKLAEPDRPVVCITGDGCFFMHGMEILTAKEYGLPILFVVMNNARLGMVYHGHSLQFKRTHSSFEQTETNISQMAQAMGIPGCRISSFADWQPDTISKLLAYGGPAIVEIALVDNNTPPMGDRVKFLSSFGK